MFRQFIPTMLLYSQRYSINPVKTQPYFLVHSYFLYPNLLKSYKFIHIQFLNIFVLYYIYYSMFFIIIYIFSYKNYDRRWDLNPNTTISQYISDKMQRYTVYLYLELLYMFRVEVAPETCRGIPHINKLCNVASCWTYIGMFQLFHDSGR